MKAKSLVFSLLLCLMALAGCEDSSIYNYYEATSLGRVIGSVHGVVTDANTNARMDGVEVRWAVKGTVNSTTTDDLGYYAITDLPPGDYEITFSGRNDHAVGRTMVSVPTLSQIFTNINSDGPYYHDEILDIDIYRLNAGLTGRVYAMEDAETTEAASGITVIADFAAYDISPDEYTTVADASGAFSFVDLPATPMVTWRTMPFSENSFDFAVQTGNVALVPAGTADAGDIILNIAPAVPFIVQNNFENDVFGLTEDIIATFSKAMETESFMITLSSITYGTVEFVATWSNDITLTIDPRVPLQANETYDLAMNGRSQDFNAFNANLDLVTVDGIQFLYTNLERVDGVFDEFPIASSIEITFTMAADLDHFDGYVLLRDEADELVSIVTSLSGDLMTLTIDPLYDLEYGQQYELSYKIYSTVDGDFDEGVINFETVSDVVVPAQITGFVVDQGAGWTADWNTTAIQFKWNTVVGADAYVIYALDNHENTDFIEVSSVDAQDHVVEQTAVVNLADFPQFDYFADDGVQTPFTAGTELTFAVAGSNDAGIGTYSTEVVVGDETAPTGNLLNQSGTADNSGGVQALVITVEFTANEYLDATPPVVGFLEAGGDPAYHLPASAASFEWDADMQGGVFTITIPAGENGSGDDFFITFDDNSGNAVDGAVSLTLF